MQRFRGVIALGVLATLATAVTADAQTDSGAATAYVSRVEVAARTIYLDILDQKGRPAEAVTADMLRVIEDGVDVPVLEVRRRSPPPAPAPRTPAVTEEPPAPAPPPIAPPHRFVLVALDPMTLGHSAWRDVIDQLAASAEALTAIGLVDVVALTSPPRRFLRAGRDPAGVRAALATLAAQVRPADRFYFGRVRAIRDFQDIFADRSDAAGTFRGRDPYEEKLSWAMWVARDLAVDEEDLLRGALGRAEDAMAQVGRPLVAVWGAQGDPDTWAFVQAQLPAWLTAQEKMRFTDQPLGFTDTLRSAWQRWAADGVTVVSWSREGEGMLEISGASTREPLRGHPRFVLGTQPLALFESVAEATGGALARDEKEIRAALATSGGRYELVYQSDKATEGWREIRVEVARAGWTARTSPRQYVFAPGGSEGSPPPALPVSLDVTSAPAAGDGRLRVVLRIAIDLAPLQGRLAPGTEARFRVGVLATPPGGAAVRRDVVLKAASLPAQGVLRYETTLLVPRGTSAYAVRVREDSTQAAGSAGPVESVPPDGVAPP